MKKISILIAEDHKLIRETWTFLLNNDARFEVVAACGDSAIAIARAEKEKPDIILMDINIEPLNGFQATTRIIQVSPESKVIGLSFYSELIFVQKMFAAGARGYLTKNSGREELYEAIVRVHGGKIYVCAEMRDKGFQPSSTVKLRDLKIDLLTSKEIQIAACIREGLRSTDIASKMKISIKTVEVHRYNIFKKLRIKSSISLINLLNTRNVYAHFGS